MEHFYVELKNKKIPFYYEKILNKIPRLVIGPFIGKKIDYSTSVIPIFLDLHEMCKKYNKTNVFYSQKPEDSDSFKLSLHIYNIDENIWYQKAFNEKITFDSKYDENIYFNENDILFFENYLFEEPDIYFARTHYLEFFKKYIVKDLIEKSWHPKRVINWCLDVEEQKELCY